MTHPLGITGIRLDPTEQQTAALRKLLVVLRPSKLCHGDCTGVDALAHDIATELGIPTHVFPPIDTKWRACRVGTFNEDPGPYRSRNQAIVEASCALIALPRRFGKTLRSGTWMTVRMAEGRKPVAIVWPDGMVERWPDGWVREWLEAGG